MSVTIRVRGTRAQVVQRLLQIGPTLSGAIRDVQAVVPEAFVAMGLAVLGLVHAHYDRLSQGGQGDDGTVWPELSPVTLGLRDKNTTPKAIAGLMSEVAKAPDYRRRMFERNLNKMKALFTPSSDGERVNSKAIRTKALRILELMKPYLTEKRYERTRKQLKLLGPKQEKKRKEFFSRVANAAAGALILRDSGRLFNSLSPILRPDNDQVLKTVPGLCEIGTNVEYAGYHQSNEPRKLKKDGTPVLPRRNFLPDIVPGEWLKEAARTLKQTIATPSFLIRFLGPLVA